MEKYVLSYGGGVNSSALFFYLLDKNMPLDIVVFADPQEEYKETYDAVERLHCMHDAKFLFFFLFMQE
jgi:hypothetical protein